MVPLRTRLQNGDIVEIVTQSGHKPSRDWLTFVATSRAREQNPPRPAHRGADAQHRARTPAVRQGSATFRPQSRDAARKSRASPDSRPSTAPSRPTSCSRTSATASFGPHRAAEGRAAGAAAGSVADRLDGQARAATGRRQRRQDQGSRHRRRDGVPREVLQPDSRREDRRLHHARQGRVRAFRSAVPTSSI